MSEGNGLISNDQIEQFRNEGYMILERAIPPEQVKAVRAECDRFIADMDREMDAAGVETQGITHKGKRYFIPHTRKKSRVMYDFAFSPVMQDICRATIGPEAVIFLDQFVVKAAEKGMSFSWHQDSGYLGFDHDPYVTCWTALEDVTMENGTVYILPYSKIGVRSRVTHVVEEGTNDKVGYFGNEEGIPVIVPAGSIAVFSSVCFHRSGPNKTKRLRPVILTQYSRVPLVNPITGKLAIDGDPFLSDGKPVMAPFGGSS